MSVARKTIEPMQPKYNAQVGRLLVYGFRGKFQHLTNLSEENLALFFEKMLDSFPAEPASLRVVALQAGEVIGTLSIKWSENAEVQQATSNLPSWKDYPFIGKLAFLKLLIGLSLLEHKPLAKECYIADVAVHPDHRSKGVGRLLLEWAQQFALAEPSLSILSLHVAGTNPRAKQLYEQLSFSTHIQEYSILRHFFFNEGTWHFMTQKLKS
ncbi:GNAT family N-acetyltransferase [Paenibacillus alvei]|uniref:GNAT family N-acetyltransferase n=1 Tax=Paenibacillus alvei TaxID=44250 RepID=UPI002281832E|nr:GNAT family N-acetyltransferase [Paenibacillus alvei]